MDLKFETLEQLESYSKRHQAWLVREAYRLGWEERNKELVGARNKPALKKPSVFVAPKLEEVLQYYKDTYGDTSTGGPAYFAKSFISHYEERNWKVGREGMTDWKSAIDNTWRISALKCKDYYMKTEKIEEKPQSHAIKSGYGLMNEL